MPPSPASCPSCESTAVQGQLVPNKSPSAGAVMAVLTNDMAAGVLSAQGGSLSVQAFCLSCGAIWLPAQESLVRSLRGMQGEQAKQRARQELEEMVKRGSGFKMVSDDDKRIAAWARSVLSGASSPSKTPGVGPR